MQYLGVHGRAIQIFVGCADGLSRSALQRDSGRRLGNGVQGLGVHHPASRAEAGDGTRFGKHLLTDYGSTGGTPAVHRKLHDLLEAVGVKSAFTRGLLEREDLDVVLVVFGEPHKAGHFFWKYMDASHPDHAPAEPARAKRCSLNTSL